MSGLPTTQRVTREELQGDAEQQLEALLRPLNLFFEDVGNALDRDLTIEENLDASIITVAIETGPAYPNDWVNIRFRHGVKRRVNGATVLNIVDDNDYDKVFYGDVWAQVRFDSTQGDILMLTGLVSSAKYTLTLLIL